MAHDGVLHIVVKILADLGQQKTLKRLRKETGDDTLRPENVPESVQNFNFNALVAGLTFKDEPTKPDSEDNATTETPPFTPGTSSCDTSTVGFNDAECKSPVKSKTKKEATGGRAAESKGRFKRIQDDVWMSRIGKDELKENSYMMKNDEFSLKAAQELVQVKGKNFRTEKMKKKRASWKGSGEITTHVNSIKFDDSDSE
ncbi:uncharacterized protein BXIN_0968 [Babesia sp. Xinjiang]|uniref:uncharacterized protein n=1 Tax=Babesia sp. Xinjiang TaxID=462227 RepID=UPI000A24BF22|nr:uncharacterized protein BXIN_0968 [Babesia sp. Xinjiang]ORM42220.1 hypothetical protein BXIN_0968 [Babesia sp. Xinjiang]